MKLTWVQKIALRIALQKLFGTERGNRLLALVESEWFAVASAEEIEAFEKPLTLLFNRNLAGFLGALPESYRSLVRVNGFVVGASGTAAAGLVDRLDGNGYSLADAPFERAAVNDVLEANARALFTAQNSLNTGNRSAGTT